MLAALALATILPFAQASAAAASEAAAVAPNDARCDDPDRRSADPAEIIVCAERSQDYRLNPDVMAAKKAKRHGRGAAPKSPENFKHNDCATVGPMGCRDGPVIDVVSAALVAAQMAAKAAQGENVGKMFVTDPHPSEYQLYLIAKHVREEHEAEEAAEKVRVAARGNGSSAKPKPVSVADPEGGAPDQ